MSLARKKISAQEKLVINERRLNTLREQRTSGVRSFFDFDAREREQKIKELEIERLELIKQAENESLSYRLSNYVSEFFDKTEKQDLERRVEHHKKSEAMREKYGLQRSGR